MPTGKRDIVPPGYLVIYRASMIDANGRRIYAREYGKRAFRIVIRDSRW